MRLSDNGRKLIQGFEGLSLKAYKDADGYSIGYGHYGANPGDVISNAEAERLFDQDVAKYETAVSLTTPSASQQQFDAMTSLAYNIGTGGFGTSTVAKLHNMGDYAGAADAFRMWVKSQGATLPVLQQRRERERSVYVNGYPGVYSQPAQSVQSPAVVSSWSTPAPSTPAASSGTTGAIAVGAVALGAVFFCPRCSAKLGVAEVIE
jgi:lysozyme